MIKKIINRRKTIKRNTEYLIKWKNYKFKSNIWQNFSKMNDIINLMRDYENIMNYIILKRYASNYTSPQKISSSKKSFTIMNWKLVRRSSSSSKFIANDNFSFNIILIKLKMIISIKISLITFSLSSSQIIFISFRRFSRLLLSFS